MNYLKSAFESVCNAIDNEIQAGIASIWKYVSNTADSVQNVIQQAGDAIAQKPEATTQVPLYI